MTLTLNLNVPPHMVPVVQGLVQTLQRIWTNEAGNPERSGPSTPTEDVPQAADGAGQPAPDAGYWDKLNEQQLSHLLYSYIPGRRTLSDEDVEPVIDGLKAKGLALWIGPLHLKVAPGWPPRANVYDLAHMMESAGWDYNVAAAHEYEMCRKLLVACQQHGLAILKTSEGGVEKPAANPHA